MEWMSNPVYGVAKDMESVSTTSPLRLASQSTSPRRGRLRRGIFSQALRPPGPSQQKTGTQWVPVFLFVDLS